MRILGRAGNALLACVAGLLASYPVAVSAETAINAVPSGWLIQRYVGGGIIIFNAGSNCSQGSLAYTGSSSEEAGELWSLIMSAKLTGKTVLIWYDETSPSCIIRSFGLTAN